MLFKLAITTAIVAAITVASTASADVGSVSFHSNDAIKRTKVMYTVDAATGNVYAKVTAYARTLNSMPKGPTYHEQKIGSGKVLLSSLKYDAAKEVITAPGMQAVCATVRDAHWPFGGIVIEPTGECPISTTVSKTGRGSYEVSVSLGFNK